MGGVLTRSVIILWRVRGEQDRTTSERRASVLQISEEGIWRGGREKKLNKRERHVTHNSMNMMVVCLDLQLKTVNYPIMYFCMFMKVPDGLIS